MTAEPFLLSDEFFRDPYPTYRSLRAQGDVVWIDELRGWLVTDLEGCRRVLSDHERFSSARARAMLEAMVPGLALEDLLPRIACDAIEQDFLFLDPPRHTHIRRDLLVALRSAIADVEPRLGAVAEALVRDLGRTSPCDLMEDFAGKFSATSLGLVFGLAPAQTETWQRWTYAAGPLFGASAALADEARRALMLESVLALNEAMAEHLFLSDVRAPFLEHLRGLVKTRVWTPEEALGAAVQLYAAGVLTTGDALILGLLALLEHPQQLALVESGAVSLDQAIDEIARFTSPTQVMHRVVRADTELGDRTLRRGDLVYAVIAAANRDPRGFDRPDAFDVTRSDASKSLAFGVGVHRCIGLGLARVELRAALAAAVPRIRTWTVAGPPRYRDYSMCFRGVDALPLVVSPRTLSSSAA